ncbi:nuclear pore complex component-domain-containing protein [Emericellopsis atlantica]|uniref:Nuclear pore complex component-domain-containing protein n=1 Tax=Emericellopsis atlantica TaxID=2614577 RepID=A0A9P7ZPE7_9HYPO|nr:nuclear pore complex component-domain-containing protein [Emericellopsis atlantica]KAG9255392.1 nuclear pore complex component-domain-containing protein [Emericellopsis atlantica]
MPSTPVKAIAASSTPVTESPGTWRHPRIDEITRRRHATTFTEKNVTQIAYGVASIIAIIALNQVSKANSLPTLLSNSTRGYFDLACYACLLMLIVNIVSACLPLIRAEDSLADIPLTPAQRKLLGLPPSGAAPTPNATYSTPPRYSRTPSLSGSIGSRGSYASGSPLSGRGSPALQASDSYSPLASPLGLKGLDASVNGRRSSFGQSNLGASTSSNLFSDSPSPSGNKRTSVGLNSKWLYERGRRSSGGAWAR